MDALVEDCFAHDYSSLDADHKSQSKDTEKDIVEKSIFDCFIIGANSKLYKLWLILEALCCLISPFIYAVMAAFVGAHPGEPLFIMMYSFESIFLLTVVMKFFVEYRNEGDERPVRDLLKIG